MKAAKTCRVQPGINRSQCPVTVALDTLGDKWSLVVLRDMFIGKKRFSEFLESPEGIQRNILTNRLKRLEKSGIIKRTRYQRRPDRYDYHLTRAGADLLPVLQAFVRWSMDHVSGVWSPKEDFFQRRPSEFYEQK